MYAIVDIEATGSPVESNAIIEIAIILHDGEKVERRYNTLINPQMRIPYFVTRLTRISNNMVANAPLFKEVAPEIFRHLQGRIFVAHNVNFDLSFLQHHLRKVGYEWVPKKICTFKLSRKVFPGLKKYGLEFLAQTLDIQLHNSHRATGDAEATALLFEKILLKGGEDLIRKALKEKDPVRAVSSFIPKQFTRDLSNKPGIFYLDDAEGNVLYIGKAKRLRRDVKTYLADLNTKPKLAEFVKKIHIVRSKESATYFTASLLESTEIQQLKPMYNQIGKDPLPYGIYLFQDNSGYQRLMLSKKSFSGTSIALFAKLADGYYTLHKMARDFQLHPALCSLKEEGKNGINIDPVQYNVKVQKAVEWLSLNHGTFVIKERETDITNCVLVENGSLYGLGIVNEDIGTMDLIELKSRLTLVPNNEVTTALIRTYVHKHPENLKFREPETSIAKESEK